MRSFITISLVILTVSCGKGNKNSEKVTLTEGIVSSCSVSRSEELQQVVITCPDGSQEIIHDGKDGQSCNVEDIAGGAMVTCGDTQAFIRDGIDGKNATACTVKQGENGSGALVSCGDGSSAFINHGKDGLDFIAEIIDPCGSETTHGLDEVLLVLQSGDILAHYSYKKLNYLTILQKEKNYITTDGTNCEFFLTKDGKVEY